MSDSTVVLTYGPSGVGKTTDQGYSFPRGLFAAAPGALTSLKQVCGYIPAKVDIKTIEEATTLLREVKGKYRWMIIDDFSFMAEQTFGRLERTHNGFKLWGALRETMLRFRDAARYAEVNVVMNAWEQAPRLDHKKNQVRGGPMLSGRLPEQVPAMSDLVMRACYDPSRSPWPAVYRCYLDPAWAMKDRFNVAIRCDPAPMNLGEILRASGVTVERHPDLPEQEAWVEKLCAKFSELETAELASTVNAVYAGFIEKGMPETAARWTLRDALDRMTIRKALTVSRTTFWPQSDQGSSLLA